LVVDAAEAVETDLGDGDAAQRHVELPVAAGASRCLMVLPE
jgi:hypothetical protein